MHLDCEDCYWSGMPEELVSKTDDVSDRDFSFCPGCGGTNFEEFEDEEDET